MASFNQWQTPQYAAGSSPQDINLVQPGWAPSVRDPLDHARMAFSKRTPDAQYPDGYLSAPPSRRQRLYESSPTPSRLPSQRGLHKVDAVPVSDYFWPEEMDPFIALRYQASGKKFVTPGVVRDSLDLDDRESAASPEKISSLRSMAPRWSTGLRMQPLGTNSYA